MKETSMEKAIIRIFQEEDSNEVFEVKDICWKIPSYYELTDYQKEIHPKYPQPRFHHEIRSILNKLKKEGLLTTEGRNRWKINRD